MISDAVDNDGFLSDDEFYRLLESDGIKIVGPITKRIEICSEQITKDQAVEEFIRGCCFLTLQVVKEDSNIIRNYKIMAIDYEKMFLDDIADMKRDLKDPNCKITIYEEPTFTIEEKHEAIKLFAKRIGSTLMVAKK